MEGEMRKLLLAAILAVPSCIALAPSAWAWTEIAARDVKEVRERDEIDMPGNQEFHRIRVCTYDNPVHFRDFDIFYANGGHRDVTVRALIAPGTCTRSIEFEGPRDIARIVFRYETAGWFIGHATVRVFGE
jgi:hypothetical protein